MIIAQDERIVKCQPQDPCLQFLQHPACRLCYDECALARRQSRDRRRQGGLCRGLGSGDHPPAPAGRLTYRTLKRQFELDDTALEELKEELIYGQRLAVDEDERVLVWMGDTAVPTPPASGRATALDTSQVRAPSPTHRHIWRRKSSPHAVPWKASASRSPCCLPISKAPWSCWPTDPEEARQLDPVLERMMAAVHRYEGTVNQVMGDGIMALFGAPLAHEDHAVRACYAALAMHRGTTVCREVQRTHGVPLQMRVGLNAGEVVVRTIGNDLHMDYSAIGQTTHLAARMEQMAMPGSILITPAVLGLAEGYVQVGSLGPMPIKARRASGGLRAGGCEWHPAALAGGGGARAHALCRPGHGTRGPGPGPGAGGSSQGQVVAVVGEAGGEVPPGVRVCPFSPHAGLAGAGECLGVLRQGHPYFPVIDLLKRYVHVEDADEPVEPGSRKVLTLDETCRRFSPPLAARRPAGRQPVSHPRSTATAPASPTSSAYCARARCSRCCWSLKICTGSIPRRRPCSTVSSQPAHGPHPAAGQLPARIPARLE